MICAIDFGNCWIRTIYRADDAPPRLTMYVEKAEYTTVADTDVHRRTLADHRIPYAECDGLLMIAGSVAATAQWLSRVPCASLLPEGRVPVDDPPARQMLGLLTGAMLPRPAHSGELCGVILPGVCDDSETATHSREFLCRLVQTLGFEPLLVNPAEAAMLASGRDNTFTGISVVLGAETTSLCVARYGRPIASETLAIGCNRIDSEIARQCRMQRWDDEGTCYLDLEAVRLWKATSGVHLSRAGNDRERALVRLYTVVLDQVAQTIVELMDSVVVRNALQQQRVPVLLAGGGALVEGLTNLMTDRLTTHQIAQRVLSVRVARDAANAVVRGSLIAAELEARKLTAERAA